MLPPLPYAYQPPPPKGHRLYGSGSLSVSARNHNLAYDPVPSNAFVAKLNMEVEPIVVRDLVNSERTDVINLVQ